MEPPIFDSSIDLIGIPALDLESSKGFVQNFLGLSDSLLSAARFCHSINGSTTPSVEITFDELDYINQALSSSSIELNNFTNTSKENSSIIKLHETALLQESKLIESIQKSCIASMTVPFQSSVKKVIQKKKRSKNIPLNEITCDLSIDELSAIDIESILSTCNECDLYSFVENHIHFIDVLEELNAFKGFISLLLFVLLTFNTEYIKKFKDQNLLNKSLGYILRYSEGLRFFDHILFVTLIRLNEKSLFDLDESVLVSFLHFS